MLGQNFMGLYDPSTSGGLPSGGSPQGQPQNFPTLDPRYGMLQPGASGNVPMLQQKAVGAPAPQAPVVNPWDLLKPKLDAYLGQYFMGQQEARGNLPEGGGANNETEFGNTDKLETGDNGSGGNRG